MDTFRSLVALLARRAADQGDDRAYVFLSDRGTEETALTFRQLHDAVTALAQRLIAAAQPIDFVAGIVDLILQTLDVGCGHRRLTRTISALRRRWRGERQNEHRGGRRGCDPRDRHSLHRHTLLLLSYITQQCKSNA